MNTKKSRRFLQLCFEIWHGQDLECREMEYKWMFNTTSLREQVYLYLVNEIQSGELRPGSLIKLDVLSKQLTISTTPLKEAIVKLECEGFVEILPRKGILVKKITSQEFKDLYEIIGACESMVLISVFERLTKEMIKLMKQCNEKLLKALENKEFDTYYQLNLEFHEYFLVMSPNMTLRKYIGVLKQRLYDFTRRSYVKAWELENIEEHRKLIMCIEEGDREGAAKVLQDKHWGWAIHESQALEFHELNA